MAGRSGGKACKQNSRKPQRRMKRRTKTMTYEREEYRLGYFSEERRAKTTKVVVIYIWNAHHSPRKR